MMLQNCQQSCEISVCERVEARHVDCRRDISLWHADQCEIVRCANQLVYQHSTATGCNHPMTEIS